MKIPAILTRHFGTSPSKSNKSTSRDPKIKILFLHRFIAQNVYNTSNSN
jgi:hypothetical protein